MRFYMSRIQEGGAGSKRDGVSPDSVMREFAQLSVGVWEAGDGCPRSCGGIIQEIYFVFFNLLEPH